MAWTICRSLLSTGDGSTGPLVDGNLHIVTGIDCGELVVQVAHSENGSSLLAGLWNGQIKVFNALNGNLMASLDNEEILKDSFPLSRMKCKPVTETGATNLVAATYVSGHLRIWNHSSGQCIAEVQVLYSQSSQTLFIYFNLRLLMKTKQLNTCVSATTHLWMFWQLVKTMAGSSCTMKRPCRCQGFLPSWSYRYSKNVMFPFRLCRYCRKVKAWAKSMATRIESCVSPTIPPILTSLCLRAGTTLCKYCIYDEFEFSWVVEQNPFFFFENIVLGC